MPQIPVLPPQLPSQHQSAVLPPRPGNLVNAVGNGGGRVSTGTSISSIRVQSTHESLGTKTIEGLLVEGTRSTALLPEGAVGNDRPITMVSESWYSPDLKEVVESTHSDPRTGESGTRLTNIDRNNPDPSLFEVPAGYEMIDDPDPNIRVQQR
jgi:hypothetical protein